MGGVAKKFVERLQGWRDHKVPLLKPLGAAGISTASTSVLAAAAIAFAAGAGAGDGAATAASTAKAAAAATASVYFLGGAACG